ncbi:hypothetical protein EDB89DRAFT_164876 [Lactarius sanguifluus]|nr:hypothetical protein EDB89DRAFT_164876 [Lactarius sanguifluus]
MDASRKDILSYAATCNPPRRAKRPSTGGNPPAVENSASQPLPTLAPAMVALSADVITQADDDDFTTADVPQPKRRGRKPSSLSRAARESMRRQNHSRIEKARRTKINEALAMLRDLVPADAGRRPLCRRRRQCRTRTMRTTSSDLDLGRSLLPTGGKQRQEKEFKLEILEKAVAYVQELQEKVRILEVRGCVRCSDTEMAAPTYHLKRKRDELPSNEDHDSHSSADLLVERPHKRLIATLPVPPPILPPSNTRLPSISSWLPKSVDSVLPEARTPPINPIQLPTPPASAVIGPITSPQVPPSLRLELPMASLATRKLSTPTKSASSSPSWTPEDESIASLLLRIKSSSSPKASRHWCQCQRPARSYPRSALLWVTMLDLRVLTKCVCRPLDPC